MKSSRARGVTMVEYALLSAVMVVAVAATVRVLGRDLNFWSNVGTAVLSKNFTWSTSRHIPPATDPANAP